MAWVLLICHLGNTCGVEIRSTGFSFFFLFDMKSIPLRLKLLCSSLRISRTISGLFCTPLAAPVGRWTEQVGFPPITPVSNAAVGVGAAVRTGLVRCPGGILAGALGSFRCQHSRVISSKSLFDLIIFWTSVVSMSSVCVPPRDQLSILYMPTEKQPCCPEENHGPRHPCGKRQRRGAQQEG